MFSTSVRVSAYDRDSLNATAHADVDVYHQALSDVGLLELQQASPRSPIVLRSHTNEYGVRSRVLQVFDPLTLARVREMHEAPFDAYYAKLLVLAPPDPLSTFHVVVNGRTALLTWTALPDIGEYEVVVGSAPGLSNIGTFRTGGVPQALFHDIPPGTFYVRVRAVNELGSVETPESQIFVP
jgi:hypothetical protein